MAKSYILKRPYPVLQRFRTVSCYRCIDGPNNFLKRMLFPPPSGSIWSLSRVCFLCPASLLVDPGSFYLGVLPLLETTTAHFGERRYKEPDFTALYERLLARGKSSMQTYVAVQRKLLIRSIAETQSQH